MAVRAARLVSPGGQGRRGPGALDAPCPSTCGPGPRTTLGSRVVEAHDQVGGMSPGCATRLVGADGSRAFVKAVGVELNPRTPFLFRREITALGLIGSHELWADLRASYDDGDWVAVMLEDVEGVAPRPRRRRHDGPPAPRDRAVRPGAGRTGARPARARPRERRAQRPAPRGSTTGRTPWHWRARSPPTCCPPGFAVTPRPGSLSCVPWPTTTSGSSTSTSATTTSFSARAASWSSSTGAAPGSARAGSTRCWRGWSASSSRGSTRSIASSPALLAAGDLAVDAWLVGFAVFLAWRAAHRRRRQPARPSTISGSTESRRMLAGAERRLGIA